MAGSIKKYSNFYINKIRLLISNNCTVLILIIISLFLSFKILSLSGLVIGDNFYWIKSTINDVLGLKIIRESYLGDVALLSTFRIGFLYPLTYLLNILNISTNFVYPFLFYLFCMLSFYSLSKEFFDKELIKLIISIMYIINPVIPYYFISINSAFLLIFLPLVLKYFIRTLREINKELFPKYYNENLYFCALFLSLSISAHEQFIPSILIFILFISLTFFIISYKNYCGKINNLKIIIINLFLFSLIIFIINIPLFISLININNAPLSTYFTGRFQDFFSTIKYTYFNSNLINLLRFGGDGGVGLGLSAWFDSKSIFNLFGYLIFILIIFSFFILLFKKIQLQKNEKYFFYITFSIFIISIILIQFIKFLSSNPVLSLSIFNLALQTWESPVKLRVIMFLSGLTSAFVAFLYIEKKLQTKNRSFILFLIVVFSSTIAYNSPWIIDSVGQTPIQGISNYLGWGNVYDLNNAHIANQLQEDFQAERGLVIPYTHKTELYSPPNFRLFQLVSPINDVLYRIDQETITLISDIFNILSIKYILLTNNNNTANEILLYPHIFVNNLTNTIDEIKTDPNFTIIKTQDNYTLLENKNALPILYASNEYIYYDDINTMKYMDNNINYSNLPVFINASNITNKLFMPDYADISKYDIYTVSLNQEKSNNLLLNISNENSNKTLELKKYSSSIGYDLYSASFILSAGDVISVTESNTSNVSKINDIIINSTSFYLGSFKNFILKYSVNIIKEGVLSFLSPRVIMDFGNSTKYILIFHSNGGLELATLKDDIFTSNVAFKNIEVENLNDPINVTINKEMNEVGVFINGGLKLKFISSNNLSKVYLSSEQSISRFTNIRIEDNDVVGLFAVRQVDKKIDYYVSKINSEEGSITVFSPDSDYAIVDQHMNTPLRYIESKVDNLPITANLFFNGWIINNHNLSNDDVTVIIDIHNSFIIKILTLSSILSTYLILIILNYPKIIRLKTLFSKLRID